MCSQEFSEDDNVELYILTKKFMAGENGSAHSRAAECRKGVVAFVIVRPALMYCSIL